MRHFVIALTLIAGCQSAPPRSAGAVQGIGPAGGCEQLQVIPSTERFRGVFLADDEIVCRHGFVVEIVRDVDRNVEVVRLRQSFTHGPDCDIKFRDRDGATWVINTQQNFCELEAGKITAKPLGGRAMEISTTEGSLRDGQPGRVDVTLK